MNFPFEIGCEIRVNIKNLVLWARILYYRYIKCEPNEDIGEKDSFRLGTIYFLIPYTGLLWFVLHPDVL